MIVVSSPGPRWRPVRLFRHDTLDEAVGAMRKCGTVLPHGTVHKPQVLKQQELSVGIEPVEGLPAGVILKRLGDIENIILRNRSRRARSTRMKPIFTYSFFLDT